MRRNLKISSKKSCFKVVRTLFFVPNSSAGLLNSFLEVVLLSIQLEAILKINLRLYIDGISVTMSHIHRYV